MDNYPNDLHLKAVIANEKKEKHYHQKLIVELSQKKFKLDCVHDLAVLAFNRINSGELETAKLNILQILNMISSKS